MTFAELFTAVDANVWPEGHARKLQARAKDWLRDALIDLQKKVPQLRHGHISYIGQSATYYKCGVSAFEAPRGRVDKLSVRRTDGKCCEVVCRATPRNEIEAQARYCSTGCSTPLPENTNPSGPFGLMTPDSTIDLSYRPDIRKAALFNGYIWIWPLVSSTEEVVLEWSGSKRNWNTSDIFSARWLDEDGEFDREIQRMIESFLNGMKHWHESCDMGKAVPDMQMYDRLVAEYIVARRREDTTDHMMEPFFR